LERWRAVALASIDDGLRAPLGSAAVVIGRMGSAAVGASHPIISSN
jgi:hypothetical protein